MVIKMSYILLINPASMLHCHQNDVHRFMAGTRLDNGGGKNHPRMEECLMAEPSPLTELSPLDQIRLAEAEVTRKVIAMRESSERIILDARAQAALLKKAARESGTLEGQTCRREIVSQAENEARGIVENARKRASELRRRGQAIMEEATRDILNLLLGLKENGAPNES
jgi:vacuolar-type H+-ATPase subunit H